VLEGLLRRDVTTAPTDHHRQLALEVKTLGVARARQVGTVGVQAVGKSDEQGRVLAVVAFGFGDVGFVVQAHTHHLARMGNDRQQLRLAGRDALAALARQRVQFVQTVGGDDRPEVGMLGLKSGGHLQPVGLIQPDPIAGAAFAHETHETHVFPLNAPAVGDAMTMGGSLGKHLPSA